jgi:hypothetical protein
MKKEFKDLVLLTSNFVYRVEQYIFYNLYHFNHCEKNDFTLLNENKTFAF